MTIQVQFTRVSGNTKTGPIPVSTSAEKTCPTSCPFKGQGCYAEGGPLALLWRGVTEGKRGLPWGDFLQAVRKLPKGQLWRHNQAGDLPGIGDAIDTSAMAGLVAANKGRNGFTYTHKPVSYAARPDAMAWQNAEAVAYANREGFTVNLSANDLEHADELAALDIGPVVVVLPAEQTRATKTPEGRPVAVCPATLSDSVNCATCGLCQLSNRKAIIGFPAHGASKRKASAVATGKGN